MTDQRYSRVYLYDQKRFMYDHEAGAVLYVSKADKWDYDLRRQLPHIFRIIRGYIVQESQPLAPDYWDDKGTREKFLAYFSAYLDNKLDMASFRAKNS